MNGQAPIGSSTTETSGSRLRIRSAVGFSATRLQVKTMLCPTVPESVCTSVSTSGDSEMPVP